MPITGLYPGTQISARVPVFNAVGKGLHEPRNAHLPVLTGTTAVLESLNNKFTVRYKRGKMIYSQGDAASTVYYNLKGTVLLTIVSRAGKEGVVEIVAPGEFFGEGCVFDQECRTASAVPLEATTVICLDRVEVRGLFRKSAACAEDFLRHVIRRNQRIQNHLADQLFHSSELRLARILRLLAEGRDGEPGRVALPRISQSLLAAIVGTTRSRISYFLMKFRNTGIIDCQEGLQVDTRMLDTMLQP